MGGRGGKERTEENGKRNERSKRKSTSDPKDNE